MYGEKLLSEIGKLLAEFEVYVKMRNKSNLTDINILLENVYKDVLNILFDLNLSNLNRNYSFPAIDLGDKAKKISYQITSTKDISKIEHTISEFKRNNCKKEYNELYILIISDKRNYRKQIIEPFFDSKNNILFYEDLYKHIVNSSQEKQQQVYKHLIDFKNGCGLQIITDKESVEVNTILKVIEILSKDSDDEIIESDMVPNPEYKINERFKEYREFLTSLYMDLSEIYASKFYKIINDAEIGTIKTKKISSYLKKISRKFLIESEYNFMLAYDKMKDFVEEKVKNSNIAFYDDNAIEYYILKNIVDCNIFPNE